MNLPSNVPISSDAFISKVQTIKNKTLPIPREIDILKIPMMISNTQPPYFTKPKVQPLVKVYYLGLSILLNIVVHF